MKKLNFKKILKELAIGAIILFVVSNALSYIRSPDISDEPLPKLKAKLIDGRYFTTDPTKPLLIHFWATWCPTCKMELSNIEYVSKEYNVLTIVVDSGDDKKVLSYMKEHNLSFYVTNDEKGIWAKQFNVKAFPTTFFYDSHSKLKFVEVGYSSTVGIMARLKLCK